jgi:transcriptional regulator NrdR family protein
MTCSTCGDDTRVLETRTSGGGIRRRRVCLRLECGGKFTTMEVRVPEDYQHFDGRIIVVARARAVALRAAARDIDELLSASESP